MATCPPEPKMLAISVIFLFFFFNFYFCLFAISWAAPEAYGGSQARVESEL